MGRAGGVAGQDDSDTVDVVSGAVHVVGLRADGRSAGAGLDSNPLDTDTPPGDPPWDEVAARRGLSTAPVGEPLPPDQPPREPTARATSSRDTRSAAVAWTAMSTFARLLSGIVSVGLKALELVTDR